MSQTLAGKVVLVTGAGSGIGRAAVLAFGRVGARVAVVDVRAEPAGETATLARATGAEAESFVADVSRSDDVARLVEAVAARFGALDCAFNNAGIGTGTTGGPAPTHLTPEDAWQRVIAVNLTGVWLCMKHEIAYMLEHGGGAIVNTASAAGLVGLPYASAYTASKHGVVGLTRTAALEYATQGIRVNCVCPGHTETPMIARRMSDPTRMAEMLARHPMGRLGTAKEVAETVVWLCSDAASFVTGHALSVDGGMIAQ